MQGGSIELLKRVEGGGWNSRSGDWRENWNFGAKYIRKPSFLLKNWAQLYKIQSFKIPFQEVKNCKFCPISKQTPTHSSIFSWEFSQEALSEDF